MALARQAVTTLTAIISQVRDEVSDPDTDVQGNSVTPQKYSNAQVTRAIEYMLGEMGRIRGIVAPSSVLRYVDLTVTLGEADFPSAVALNALMIYKAERVLDYGVDAITYVSALEVEQHDTPLTGIRVPHRFTIIAASDPTVAAWRFVMRPKTSCVVRLWYVVGNIIPGTGADNVPDSLPWLELIVLGAALKLMSIENRATPGQEMRYYGNGRDVTGLWPQFLLAATNAGGPKRIRPEGKFRS